MIISDKAVERRIKRANTDWWIHSKAVVGADGRTYIAYFNDLGEIHVKQFDAKCSRAVSQDVTLTRFNGSYADAAKTLAFVLACNESMDTGKPVKIDFS